MEYSTMIELPLLIPDIWVQIQARTNIALNLNNFLNLSFHVLVSQQQLFYVLQLMTDNLRYNTIQLQIDALNSLFFRCIQLGNSTLTSSVSSPTSLKFQLLGNSTCTSLLFFKSLSRGSNPHSPDRFTLLNHRHPRPLGHGNCSLPKIEICDSMRSKFRRIESFLSLRMRIAKNYLLIGIRKCPDLNPQPCA